MGRPRKEGKRKPCGRLAVFVDEGHPMVLQHRADEVGEEHKHSRFAAYVIGRLYLAGAFGADEELAEQRHDALQEYGDAHRALYGSSTAPSIMGNLAGARGRAVAGDRDPLAGLYVKFKGWYSALMILPPGPGCRLLSHQVVERAAVYEMPPANPAELACLVRAADRLVELHAGQVDSGKGRRKKAPLVRRHDPAAGDLRECYSFSRGAFGPSDEDLAEALAKYRVIPPAVGTAD